MIRLIDHLKSKTIVDPRTGSLKVIYEYKRNRCPTVVIKGHIANKYVAYCLIENDLLDVESWLNYIASIFPEKSKKVKNTGDRYYLADIENKSVVMGLYISSLAFYGKCFSQAKGRGVKLDRSIVPEEYSEKHDQIIKFRHTIVAHSGEGEWDTGKATLVLAPKKSKSIIPCLKPHLKRLTFMDDKDEKYPFLSLVRIVKKQVRVKSNLLGAKLFSDHIEPKGYEYWYKHAKAYKKL